MKNCSFLFIIFCMFLLGCEQPHPNPETLDPIYSEIQKKLGESQGDVARITKDIEGFKKDASLTQPQTGQSRPAENKVFEAELALAKAKQMVQYYELKLIERRRQARTQYLKAFRKKEPWPDPKEFQIYKNQRELLEKMAPQAKEKPKKEK